MRKTCWFCLKFYVSELLKRINRNRQNTPRRQFYQLLKYITENLKFPAQQLRLCVISDKQSGYSCCCSQCPPLTRTHTSHVDAAA